MRKAIIKLFILLSLSSGFGVSNQAQPPSKKQLLAAAQKEYDAGFVLFGEKTAESFQACIPKFTKAAQLFRQAGNQAKQGETLLLLGSAYDSLGQKEKAVAVYNQSLALNRLTKQKVLEAVTLNNLAMLFRGSGDIQKAFLYFEQGLKIARISKDSDTIILILNNLANTYSITGEKLKALKMLEEVFEIAQKREDKLAVATVLNTMGKIYSELAQKKLASNFFNKALEVSQEIKNQTEIFISLSNLGTFYLSFGENEKAGNFFNQALEIAKSSGDKEQLLLILNNMSNYYDAIGEKQIALESNEKVIALAIETNNKEIEGYANNNTGVIYYGLGKNKKALEYYRQALKISEITGDLSLKTKALNNIGMSQIELDQLSESVESFTKALEVAKKTNDLTMAVIVLNNIGIVYLKMEEGSAAAQTYQRLLPILEKLDDKKTKAKALNNLGQAYRLLNDKTKAEANFSQAVTLSRAIGDLEQEAISLNNLMMVWEDSENPRFAVFFGKQAVNIFQNLRSKIKGLDKNLQNDFLQRFESAYRNLAQILIEEGRIAEAEQVLAMLKEEEVLSFLQRDDKVAKDLIQTVALSNTEREAIDRYNQLAEKITSIGKEFSELDAERKDYDEGKFPKQARFDELKKQLADATVVFQKFLEELKLKFGQKDERVVQVDSSLQKTLERLKANKTAVVSTIIGDKYLSLIVTTATTQRAHKIEITDKEINQLVTDFRQGLMNEKLDPRPVGQKLYNILVKPIEADLAGIQAETILWSLDGTLRYIPTAALWDKEKGYLVERFSSVMLTLASRETLALPVSDKADWKALGVGVSKATEGFSALDSVPDELDCIITDAQNNTVSLKPKCQSGVLNGRKLLDEKFTLTAFENALGRYPIVHIASHFSLNPGNDKDSFLLLGGGEQKRFTVENLRGVSLTDVELLALSACNTATPGGEKNNGIEIEGFGTIAQKQGAKAVLSTLWSVADMPTSEWMVKFYGLYGKTNINKAEAMRQSQLAMINGNYKVEDGITKRRGEVINLDGSSLPEFKKDKNAPFSHPYFWSPFILIGNWK